MALNYTVRLQKLFKAYLYNPISFFLDIDMTQWLKAKQDRDS